MVAGKGRQSHLNSLGLKEHTLTALWDLPRPEGPSCLRRVPGLSAVLSRLTSWTDHSGISYATEHQGPRDPFLS